MRLAKLDGGPATSDEYGISCRVCGTRLHVRPTQVGTTIQCPDCYSPVIVNAPPQRREPNAAAVAAAAAARKPLDEATAMRMAAHAMLNKARRELEQEAADERERSPERFTGGLLAFLADWQALARLAILAVWLQAATTMFRSVSGMTVSGDLPAILSEVTSLLAVLVLGLLLLSFLMGAAACGLALVKDTSEGLLKIERWPGVRFWEWGGDVFYIVNAAILAAVPGAAVGAALGLLGIRGMVLFTAAASYVAFFPPMLLSMVEAESALAPFCKTAWGSIRQRPDPWGLTYLITTLVTIAGLFGFVASLLQGLPLGLAGAMLMVVAMMIYFRTVGRLFCRLAGR